MYKYVICGYYNRLFWHMVCFEDLTTIILIQMNIIFHITINTGLAAEQYILSCWSHWSHLEMPVPSQGHYGFHSFPVVDCFVCLYTYEFWLSLCKIVRSSVILLLPLFIDIVESICPLLFFVVFVFLLLCIFTVDLLGL